MSNTDIVKIKEGLWRLQPSLGVKRPDDFGNYVVRLASVEIGKDADIMEIMDHAALLALLVSDAAQDVLVDRHGEVDDHTAILSALNKEVKLVGCQASQPLQRLSAQYTDAFSLMGTGEITLMEERYNDTPTGVYSVICLLNFEVTHQSFTLCSVPSDQNYSQLYLALPDEFKSPVKLFKETRPWAGGLRVVFNRKIWSLHDFSKFIFETSGVKLRLGYDIFARLYDGAPEPKEIHVIPKSDYKWGYPGDPLTNKWEYGVLREVRKEWTPVGWARVFEGFYLHVLGKARFEAMGDKFRTKLETELD